MAARIAIDGLVACVPFSIVVWASFLSRPRIWLHSLPADIQRMAAPKTPVEQRLTFWLGALVLFTFFGVPALLTWRFHMWTPGRAVVWAGSDAPVRRVDDGQCLGPLGD
jgi:hypothetical protein